MKKINVFKQYILFIPKLCLVVLLGLLYSCQNDEIIPLDEENVEVDLLADTAKYKTYHKITGKDGEVIATLNDQLEYVNEAGFETPKTSDTSQALGVVFYQHSNFNGVKEVRYNGGHDQYLRNSYFEPALRTGITGVYVGPHCSVELYAQDNWVNKIRTVYGGSNGYGLHYLGSQNDQTRSAIIRCDYPNARNRFLGFVHEHYNYTGRSIPFFTRNGKFRPNDIPGFSDVGISSVSMNKYFNYLGPQEDMGVVMYDDNNNDLPILAHNDVDVPSLGRLNDRHLLFSMYTKETVKKSDTDKFLNAYKVDHGGPKLDVTIDQLNALCQPRFDACSTANGDYEYNSAILVPMCAAGFAALKSTIASIAPTSATTLSLKAAITNLDIASTASIGAFKVALRAFIAANPYTVIATITTAVAGSVGCFFILKAAANIPNLPDCTNVKEDCVNGRYESMVNCTNCPGSN